MTMKYLGQIKKAELHRFLDVTASTLFCYLPSDHPEEIEVWKTKHTLESQTGDVISNSPFWAIDILDGKPVTHYCGKKNGKTVREEIYWDMIYTCS